MNEKLQKNLSQLEELISIQKQSVIGGDPSVDYMSGMANGMILAHSIFNNGPANFVKPPYKYKKRTKVRHKSMFVRQPMGAK